MNLRAGAGFRCITTRSFRQLQEYRGATVEVAKGLPNTSTVPAEGLNTGTELLSRTWDNKPS